MHGIGSRAAFKSRTFIVLAKRDFGADEYDVDVDVDVDVDLDIVEEGCSRDILMA